MDDIIKPIEEPLARLELLLADSLDASTVPMKEIMDFLLDAKGKRLRPILVFLTAQLFGEINEQTYRVATFVEMIHTATLLHDDVVDKATVRRGKPSVNAQWDNASAVLAGDYLLAKALLLLSNPDDSAILNEMLQTSLAMSQGELTHHHNSAFLTPNSSLLPPNSSLLTPPSQLLTPPSSLLTPNSSLLTPNYLSLITQKTALLLRTCCVAAAMSVNASEEQIRLVGDFGLNLGLVFQMRDDILDAEEDDSQYTPLAQDLLPVYLQKTLDSLNALSESLSHLSPFTFNLSPLTFNLSPLTSLVNFCASRTL